MALELFRGQFCIDQDCQDTDSLQVALDPAAPPQHGTTAPSGNEGGITYTPASGYTGADAVAIRASDGDLITPASIPLHVADTAFCSPAPTLQVRPGAQKAATATCTAPNFGFTGVSLVGQPTKGSVSQFFGSTTFLYTANAGASGADSFTFKATSDSGDSPLATQAISISTTANEVPVCQEPFGPTVAYSGHMTFVFPNCFDGDFDSLTYQVVAGPSHGSTTVENGSIRYTPPGPTSARTSSTSAPTTVMGDSRRSPCRSTSGRLRRRVARPSRTSASGPAASARSAHVHEPPGRYPDLRRRHAARQGLAHGRRLPGPVQSTANAGASGADTFVLRARIPQATRSSRSTRTSIRRGTPRRTADFGSTVLVARGTTTDLPLASRCTDEEGDSMTFTRVTAPGRTGRHRGARRGPAVHGRPGVPRVRLASATPRPTAAARRRARPSRT